MSDDDDNLGFSDSDEEVDGVDDEWAKDFTSAFHRTREQKTEAAKNRIAGWRKELRWFDISTVEEAAEKGLEAKVQRSLFSKLPDTHFSKQKPYESVDHNNAVLARIMAPKTYNIMSKCQLGCPINFREIMKKANNAEYDPKRRQYLLMKLRNPSSNAHIFSTGTMACYGCKNEYSARLATRLFGRKLQKGGLNVNITNFKITAVRAVADCGFAINILDLASDEDHEEFCTYDPEQSAGVSYKMEDPMVSMNIFASGKVVFLMSRTRTDIHTAFVQLFPFFLKYMRPPNSDPYALEDEEFPEEENDDTFDDPMKDFDLL